MSRKLPPKFPLWLVKASWRGTAIRLEIPAKDEDDAWDRASKKVMRMLGGASCQDIQVIRQIGD